MARIGSIAAAPFVGDQFVSLYLGDERVPTVPGKPTVADAAASGGATTVLYAAPSQDGGSAVVSYRFFFDGVEFSPATSFEGGGFTEATFSNVTDPIGRAARIAAVNAIGTGPQSDPVVVVAA
jgi:large repetitive protein